MVIVFFCCLIVNMAALSYVMRSVHVGTAYLIGVSVGDAITLVYGMIAGEESVPVQDSMPYLHGCMHRWPSGCSSERSIYMLWS
ncbi:hypothetical protein I5Q88_04615 [Bifidobacterium animalis]|nr:hypothetical protein I5Q88_04615 [Bifidobacterium animalis]